MDATKPFGGLYCCTVTMTGQCYLFLQNPSVCCLSYILPWRSTGSTCSVERGGGMQCLVLLQLWLSVCYGWIPTWETLAWHQICLIEVMVTIVCWNMIIWHRYSVTGPNLFIHLSVWMEIIFEITLVVSSKWALATPSSSKPVCCIQDSGCNVVGNVLCTKLL